MIDARTNLDKEDKEEDEFEEIDPSEQKQIATHLAGRLEAEERDRLPPIQLYQLIIDACREDKKLETITFDKKQNDPEQKSHSVNYFVVEQSLPREKRTLLYFDILKDAPEGKIEPERCSIVNLPQILEHTAKYFEKNPNTWLLMPLIQCRPFSFMFTERRKNHFVFLIYDNHQKKLTLYNSQGRNPFNYIYPDTFAEMKQPCHYEALAQQTDSYLCGYYSFVYGWLLSKGFAPNLFKHVALTCQGIKSKENFLENWEVICNKMLDNMPNDAKAMDDSLPTNLPPIGRQFSFELVESHQQADSLPTDPPDINRQFSESAASNVSEGDLSSSIMNMSYVNVPSAPPADPSATLPPASIPSLSSFGAFFNSYWGSSPISPPNTTTPTPPKP